MSALDVAIKVCVGAIIVAYLFYTGYQAMEEMEEGESEGRGSSSPPRADRPDDRSSEKPTGKAKTKAPKSRHYCITAETKRRFFPETGASAESLPASDGLRRRDTEENWRDAPDTGLRGCCVCRDAVVEMLFNECGHVCMCESCVVHAAGGLNAEEDVDVVLRCPQCRVSGTMRRVFCS